jgi:hypothetical protein
MADFTKREVAIIAAGIIIATVLTAVGTWLLVGIVTSTGARDPLNKAGGLKPEQDIRKR